MSDPKVIIIGSHHHNTLGVIRAIGRSGINPVVIMTRILKSSYILKSKYISRSVQLNGNDKVIPYLLEHYTDDIEKPVLIACHDIISEILDKNRTTLSKYFYVPGTKEQQLEKLTNKQAMTKLASFIGLNVPFSVVSNEEFDINNLPYPVITKPSASKNGTKHDIVICQTKESLHKFLSQRASREFQIQKFINKDFEFQLIGCSINDGNEIIIPGISKLIRTASGSNTGFLLYTSLSSEFNKTINYTKKFIRATGYSGLFSVEFIRGKDGEDYFMEMNFRNDGNAICATNAGANLPMFWVQRCIGIQTNAPEIKRHEYTLPEYNEIDLWFNGGIKTSEFIKDLRLTTSYMEYASDDPAPTNGHSDFFKKLIIAILKRPFYQVAKKIGLR